MKPQQLLIILMIVGLSSLELYSQGRFGKVSKEELEMTVYEKDSSAAAVILFDVGSSRFQTTSNNTFQLVFNRHIRIKILKNEAYSEADIKIPFYKGRYGKENVSDIKASSYNLSEEGKVVKLPLEKSEIFEEDYSINWKRKTFTLPNVKEGTVIEYKYKIVSDYYSNLKEWYFQSLHPIVFSQYTVDIPEYFTYKQFQEGYAGYYTSQVERGTAQFRVTYNSQQRVAGGETNRTTNFELIQANTKQHIFKAQNVPKFEVEAYITTPQNYLSKIRFQLNSVLLPGQTVKYYSDNWDDIVEDLLNSERFGLRLQKNYVAASIAKEFIDKYPDKSERLQAIYYHFINNFEWNKVNSVVSRKLESSINSKKEGSVADINLLMTAVLNEAGFEVTPVLLSTREHGEINKFFTSISNFDYIISAVTLDDKITLLDGTAKGYPIGVLPLRCLNKTGLLSNLTKIE